MEKLKIEYIEIDKLTPFKNNCKLHTQEQIEHIKNSIVKFGFNDPLGIAGEQNMVLEGNGRIEAAKSLGYTALPCVRLDHLTKEEQQAYVIAHNALNLETGFDNDILFKELDKLKDFNFEELGLDKQLCELRNLDDDFYKANLEKQITKLVRNEFLMVGKYDFPLIRRQEIDLTDIKLMSYTNTKYNDKRNLNKTIHFFLHDYKFENTYNDAENAVEKLMQYYCLLTPDFSLYSDMPIALQINNTFKNRWVGAYWQRLGLNVIPTISWSLKESFEFCFEGIQKGSIVAVSTIGCRKVKQNFLLGYNKMLQILEPISIICYGKPFPEMLDDKLIVCPYVRQSEAH